MYLSLHSFGQKILYPWGYTKHPIKDWLELHTIAKLFAITVSNVSHGRYAYEVCSSKQLIHYSKNNNKLNIKTQLDNIFNVIFFQVGSSDGKINYNSYGNADDWARGEMGIKWTYLIELPPTRNRFPPSQQIRGFLLSPKEIVPVAYTVFQGFLNMISNIKKLG